MRGSGVHRVERAQRVDQPIPLVAGRRRVADLQVADARPPEPSGGSQRFDDVADVSATESREDAGVDEKGGAPVVLVDVIEAAG